jgi:hypothetical protein
MTAIAQASRCGAGFFKAWPGELLRTRLRRSDADHYRERPFLGFLLCFCVADGSDLGSQSSGSLLCALLGQDRANRRRARTLSAELCALVNAKRQMGTLRAHHRTDCVRRTWLEVGKNVWVRTARIESVRMGIELCVYTFGSSMSSFRGGVRPFRSFGTEQPRGILEVTLVEHIARQLESAQHRCVRLTLARREIRIGDGHAHA